MFVEGLGVEEEKIEEGHEFVSTIGPAGLSVGPAIGST
jgi:hypothetical protein